MIDKKRLKWEQDTQENYNPYGKPGAGAGPPKQPPTQTTPNLNIEITNTNTTSRPSNSNLSKTSKYNENLEEYKRINDTLARIVEAENKIKAEQIEALKQQVIEQQQVENQQQQQHQLVHQESVQIANNDQKMVPAAMRTSLMFGVSL